MNRKRAGHLHLAAILAALLPAACDDANPAGPLDPAATTASYRVTFDATWSAFTHPVAFPPNPHFSGLIGATHNANLTIWEPGGLATTGVKSMAETGSKSALQAEVNLAIQAGTAGRVLSGGGIIRSPGAVSLDFEIATDFSRVSLVSMIAPSPDWFVGVMGLDLRPNGQWLESISVDLFAYDSGTDSGPTYTAPNAAMVPPAPIESIGSSPFAAGNRLGTLTFVRR